MNADLRLCNLVSRGVPLNKAREMLGLEKPTTGSEPEAVELTEPTEAVEADESELESLRSQLAELGIHASPRAKVETLRKKLDEALAGDDE